MAGPTGPVPPALNWLTFDRIYERNRNFCMKFYIASRVQMFVLTWHQT